MPALRISPTVGSEKQATTNNLPVSNKFVAYVMVTCYNDTVERGTGTVGGTDSAARVDQLVGRCKTTFSVS